MIVTTPWFGEEAATKEAVPVKLPTTLPVTLPNNEPVMLVDCKLVKPAKVVVEGDLTVNGTASYINTQDLLVEDKFVLFASGSTTATDGGFIVAQSGGNTGQAFAWDASENRWGIQSGVGYDATSITPEAYASMVVETANINNAAFKKTGNMYVDAGEIYIWA